MAARTNTLVSSSIPSVLRYLSGRFSPNRTSSQPLLYVLSPAHSLPAEELSSIVSFLTSVPNSVGCLGSTLPLSVRGLSHRTSTTVLSLAQFDSTKASTFRSEIPGKPEAQVGRWHRILKADDPTILTPPIERGPLSHPPWLQGESFSIPSELFNFRSVHIRATRQLSYIFDCTAREWAIVSLLLHTCQTTLQKDCLGP